MKRRRSSTRRAILRGRHRMSHNDGKRALRWGPVWACVGLKRKTAASHKKTCTVKNIFFFTRKKNFFLLGSQYLVKSSEPSKLLPSKKKTPNSRGHATNRIGYLTAAFSGAHKWSEMIYSGSVRCAKQTLPPKKGGVSVM